MELLAKTKFLINQKEFFPLRLKSKFPTAKRVSINISCFENTSLIRFAVLGIIILLRDKPHQATPVLEHDVPRMDVGENVKKRAEKRREGENKRERDVEKQSKSKWLKKYLNDGICTGRLHGDDLQANRPICLRIQYNTDFYEREPRHRPT